MSVCVYIYIHIHAYVGVMCVICSMLDYITLHMYTSYTACIILLLLLLLLLIIIIIMIIMILIINNSHNHSTSSLRGHRISPARAAPYNDNDNNKHDNDNDDKHKHNSNEDNNHNDNTNDDNNHMNNDTNINSNDGKQHKQQIIILREGCTMGGESKKLNRRPGAFALLKVVARQATICWKYQADNSKDRKNPHNFHFTPMLAKPMENIFGQFIFFPQSQDSLFVLHWHLRSLPAESPLAYQKVAAPVKKQANPKATNYKLIRNTNYKLQTIRAAPEDAKNLAPEDAINYKLIRAINLINESRSGGCWPSSPTWRRCARSRPFDRKELDPERRF